MAVWQPSAGATLLIASGAGKHLFVVLNDPVVLEGYGQNPCVVRVNLSTVRPEIPYDATCVLPAGCHPFVVAPNYVRYQDARIYRASEQLKRVRGVAATCFGISALRRPRLKTRCGSRGQTLPAAYLMKISRFMEFL